MGRPGSTVASAALAVVLVAAGVGVAVVRHDRGVERRSDAAAEEQAGYEHALQRARAQPPVFELAFVQFPLRDLRSAAAGATLVADELTTRLRTNRPPVRPDFAQATGAAWIETLARGVAEHRVHVGDDWVLALRVRQVSPGAGTLRLRVERVALPTYEQAWDATDFAPGQARTWNGIGRHTAQTIVWRPTQRRASLVPLVLLHDLTWKDTTANSDLMTVNGGAWGTYLVGQSFLLARRLVLHGAGRDAALPLARALEAPLVLAPRSGGG